MCCLFFVCFCPICGPCHHKCSRPPLDTTMQSQISSWLLMGCACLLQHGFYSVLDTNTAAALYTHAAVLFSCHAVQRGYTGPVYVPHSLWLRGVPFCCCTQAKSNRSNKSLHRDAVSLGSDMFTTLIPVQRRWSFVMIHIHDGHFFFCLSGANFNPTAPPSESGGIIFWKFLCACAYWKCTIVYMHFSFISNYLAPSFIIGKEMWLKKVKVCSLQTKKSVCYKNNCTMYHFSATVSARHVQTRGGP